MESITGHAILKIVKGVQIAPQDANSAEAGLDSIDLLDPLGFSTDTYDMKIPALKSSAIYADSPLTDGRTLISGVLGNVTETIRCELTAGTIIQLSAMLSKLLHFKQDCNDFWDTYTQIEPVYLKHQIIGEPGPRYALLYDIDIDVDTPLIPSEAKRTVTIVIEREFGWRGLAPGANPKQWTAYKRGETFNAAYADLTAAGIHLAKSTTLLNGNEYQTRETFLNKNALTIPAESIDGDLPALTFISVVASGSAEVRVMISRDTKPETMPSTNTGAAQIRKLDLIAAAATLGTNAAFVSDIFSLAYVPVSATRRRIDVSFGTAADSVRATWSNEANITSLRGRYTLFARIRQYAGAQNDLRYYVRLSTNTSDTFWTSPTMTPTLLGTIAAGPFGLDYLGVIDLPFKGRSVSQIKGKGLLVSGSGDSPTTENFLYARLNASRVAGTTAILAISDLILMPIDEGACKIITPINSSLFPSFIDNTGYFDHGGTDTIADTRRISLGSADTMIQTELQGNGITLLPGVDNRLVFLVDEGVAGSTPNLQIGSVSVDIVPRWSSYRDK